MTKGFGASPHLEDHPAELVDGPLPRPVAVRVLALTKSTGGLAIYHRALVVGLAPEEFAVHTICLSDNAASFAAELEKLGHTAESVQMARYKLDPRGDVRVLRLAARAARTSGADVILCHGSKAGMIGRAVGWMLKVPVVYCQASLPFLPRVQGRKAAIYRLIERGGKLLGGHIVALTEGARTSSLAHGVAVPEAISVIRTGIDFSRFKPRGCRADIRRLYGIGPDAPVVLWMGRFEAQKAPEVFLGAVDILCSQVTDAEVVIVGEGSMAAEIEAHIAASPHRARIHLLPWQSDPAALMEACDVLCLSSRWEGLPLVLLEAMAIGAVPVSTAVDGCAEVIEDGVSGRLVPPDDPAALAQALVETASDRDGMARLSRAAIERAHRDFTSTRMMAEWKATLRSLAARRGH